MKARHIVLLLAIVVELVLFFFCLIGKTNRNLAGYICAGLSLVLVFFTGWLLLFPKMTPVETTGEYEVGQEDCFYTDTSRIETFADDNSNRELSVSFWYPKGYSEQKSCPLVVFSHGSFGVKESNETLYRELASHGYVVCAMNHTYHCFSTKLSNGKTVRVNSKFMKELQSENVEKNPEQSVKNFSKWMDLRTKDINFVMDTIKTKVVEGSNELSVYKLIDFSRIGVMGHSLGGSAALGIGRQRKDIKAVIALESPLMCDIQGVNEDGSLKFDETEYPVPVLNVYSDASWKHLKEWKQYKGNAMLLDSKSDKVENVYMSGIGHFSLTDLSMTTPFLTSIFDGKILKDSPQKTLEKLNGICLEFLDKYVK